MLAINMLLVCLVANTHVQSTEPCDKRKEKRRVKNMMAAKKSYEAKKTQRQSLQQINTELVEIQKQLLHDKSRLQSKITLLKRIADSMEHTFTTCKSLSQVHTASQDEVSHDTLCVQNNLCEDSREAIKDKVQTESQTEVSQSRMFVSSQSDLCEDNNQALDLSINKQSCMHQHNTTLTTYTAAVNRSFYITKIVPLIHRTSSSLSKHEASSIVIGTAHEVGLAVCVPQANTIQHADTIKQESEVCAFNGKKIKIEA